ncbi:MAG: hypothetical protein K8R68_11900 [Bacteroidales bacterium]|nr:hypothetical protein [Bacteroidales bacterium]
MNDNSINIDHLEELLVLVTGTEYEIRCEEVSKQQLFFIAPIDEDEDDIFYSFLKAIAVRNHFNNPIEAVLLFFAIRNVWIEHHSRIEDLNSCINRLTNFPF